MSVATPFSEQGVFPIFVGNNIHLTSIYPLFLLSLRIAVVFALTPVMYAAPIPARIKALLVLTLAIAVAAGILPSNATTSFSSENLIQAALRELALGLILAMGIFLAFTAFSIAGNLLDIQIGFGIAQIFDPMTNRPVPILVSAFNHVAVLVFFLVDGHHALLRGLSYSLEVFPVGTPWLLDNLIEPVLKQVGGLFSLGFALAAPVVFSILLVELALGIVSRSLPQVNMFALGIPVKIIVGLVFLSLWFTGIGGVMTKVYTTIYSTWTAVFMAAKS